jgi:hypothetical protein
MRIFIVLSLFLVLGFAASHAAPGNPPWQPEATFCEALSDLVNMAATDFKDLQGELNDAATVDEEADVFNTTQIMPQFESGLLLPTMMEGKKKVGYTKFFATEDAAVEHLITVEMDAKACLVGDKGFKYREDSGIEVFESATVTVHLMTVEDYDEEGNSFYKVLLQAWRK